MVGCGGCLTVKNLWGLLTGDDGVGFNYYINLLSKQNLMKTVWISPGVKWINEELA